MDQSVVRTVLVADVGLPPRLRNFRRVGYWPALILFAGFAWFELIDPAPDDPARLAAGGLSYLGPNFVAMQIFGYRDWDPGANSFGVLSAWFRLRNPGQRQRQNREVIVWLPGANCGGRRCHCPVSCSCC